MAASSSAGPPLPQPPTITHGDGGDRGDGCGSDDAASTLHLPSYAPSNVSRMPGDMDDLADDVDFVMKPDWGADGSCSIGEWDDHTSDDGEAAAASSFQGGTYGLLSANWGGKWKDPKLNDHMNKDLKTTPCQVLCLQEAEESLQDELGIPHVHDTGGGTGAEKLRSRFISIRGPESRATLMISARQSLVSGIRMLVFHRIKDGTYRVTGKSNKPAKNSSAVSRIMIASLKMRFARNRGGGDDEEDDSLDQLRVANVHLHFRTAKKELRSGATAWKRFWDLLARYMNEFCPTFLCGDFNMALFSVVPELRARGFQVNLAAWYCWQNDLDPNVRADSCAIFRIGPSQGIRLCFDASVFGFKSPTLPANCSMMMEIVRDKEGKVTDKRRHEVPQFELLGQGYYLESYRPLEATRKEQFVMWTFTPVFDDSSSAVADIIECAKSDKAMFPSGVDTSIGSGSWSWPESQISKQKLASYDLFDPDKTFFKRGAHMPLMVYIGGPSDSRRSPLAMKRRAANATKRGWTWQRRQTTKGGSDGRQHPKGKQKGSGKHSKGGGKDSKGGSRGGGKGNPW